MSSYQIISLVLIYTLSVTNSLLLNNNRVFNKHSTIHGIQNSNSLHKRYGVIDSSLLKTFLAAPGIGDVVVAEVDDIVSSFEDPFISLKVVVKIALPFHNLT